MIANFFKKSKPVIVFNLIILLFFFYIASIISLKSIELTTLMWFKKAGMFLLLVLFILIVNFIIKRNNLTQDNSFSLLLCVLLLGIFNYSMLIDTILYANILLLLAFRKIYSIKSGINVGSKLFDAGLWIGCAALIYPPSILFLLLILVAVIIYQKLRIQNFIIPFLGLTGPLLLYFTYCVYFDMADVFYNKFSFPVNFDFTVYNKLNFLIAITFLITITVWSVFVVTPKIIQISNTLRMSWNVLINQLLIGTVIAFVAPVKNGSEFLFIIFPCAVIITNFIQKSQSSNFKNLVLYLFVLISVGVYFL